MQKVLSKVGFDEKTFFQFFLISTNSQLIYSFVNLKTILYEPFTEALHVTDTQFGILQGIIGFILVFGGSSIGWLQDRFSSRNLLGVNSLMYSAWALILSFWPECPFALKCVLFTAFGFNADAMYWATVLRKIRTLAPRYHQATAFGLFESIRGLWGFAASGLAVWVYTILDNTAFGMQVVMVMSALFSLFSGLSILFFLPKNAPTSKSEKIGAGIKKAFSGYLTVLRMPEIWLTGLAASCVYASHCVVIVYFVPYLQKVYLLPVALAGIFGLANSSITRFISAPIAGLISDSRFKSSAHMMRVCYCILFVLLVAVLFLPKDTTLVFPAMILLLLIAVVCFLICGIYYTPIGELGVPKKVTTQAMAITSGIGYSPSLWAFPLFGVLIDRFPAQKAYSMIFALMVGFAFLGIILTTIIGKKILARRA